MTPKTPPPEIYKQLIKNDEPIFAIYRDENKVHSFSRILFFAVLEKEEYIQCLVFDSDLGLSPADQGGGNVGYYYGPIEHIDYANY